jgi:ketosteroid isomerase-like protein
VAQEKVELLRAQMDDWNRGEWADRSRFHPDVEFLPMRAATEGAYRGHAGIDKFAADTEEMFDKFEFHEANFLEVGDRVIAWCTLRFRARGSGVETNIDTGGVFDFRDGKIVRWEDLGSKEAALAAVGL